MIGVCSGEYILLIDSDTRVPEVSLLRSSFTSFRLSVVPILTGLFWASLLIQDCFLDAASELDASPEVAILQHESDVMLVIGHYFENGEYICFCCSDGTRAFVLTRDGFDFVQVSPTSLAESTRRFLFVAPMERVPCNSILSGHVSCGRAS